MPDDETISEASTHATHASTITGEATYTEDELVAGGVWAIVASKRLPVSRKGRAASEWTAQATA